MTEQMAMAAPLTSQTKPPPLHIQLTAKICVGSADKQQSLQHEICCVESDIR